jgi:hypothetical protein
MLHSQVNVANSIIRYEFHSRRPHSESPISTDAARAISGLTNKHMHMVSDKQMLICLG